MAMRQQFCCEAAQTTTSLDNILVQARAKMTEFRQPIQVQSHLEMPGILVQLGHIQRT